LSDSELRKTERRRKRREEKSLSLTRPRLVPRATNVWRRREEEEFERNSFFGFAFSHSLLSIIITQIFKTI